MALTFLTPVLASACLGPYPPLLPGPSLHGLTWALVELAGLGDVPLAEPGPLANGRFHSVHLVLGNNGVQEDAPEKDKPHVGENLREGGWRACAHRRSRPRQSPDIPRQGQGRVETSHPVIMLPTDQQPPCSVAATAQEPGGAPEALWEVRDTSPGNPGDPLVPSSIWP